MKTMQDYDYDEVVYMSRHLSSATSINDKKKSEKTAKTDNKADASEKASDEATDKTKSGISKNGLLISLEHSKVLEKESVRNNPGRLL